MKESDHGAFELSALLGSDGNGWKTSPEDVLANVSCDEERDTTSETIALLQELIKKDNNDTSSEELEENEKSVDCTEIWEFTIHAGKDVGKSLTESDD